MGSNHWKDLLVWKKAHQLNLELYAVNSSSPECEKFNLLSQLKRASTSVATNIVEGHDRSSKNDFLRFYIFPGDLLKKSDN